MNIQKEYWNNQWQRQMTENPIYDSWLDKYMDLFMKAKAAKIIDLGCGQGNNTLYLTEKGCRVIACDISEVAIERVKNHIPQAETMIFDMLDGLPFKSNSIKIVIADLCLHYFTWKETVHIAQEINRILVDGGNLLLRVNSTNDVNHGAGQGIAIEENFYEVMGTKKRFFNRKQIEALFGGWKLAYIQEYQMDRYTAPKLLWEASVVKAGGLS